MKRDEVSEYEMDLLEAYQCQSSDFKNEIKSLKRKNEKLKKEIQKLKDYISNRFFITRYKERKQNGKIS